LERFLEVLSCQGVKHSPVFGLDLHNGIKPASFQLFDFIFGNRKKSQGSKSGDYGGWGMTAVLFSARNCWVMTKV
jgi:hypothetical protein